MASGSSARLLSARIRDSSVVCSHSDAGSVTSCCFHRFSDFGSTVAGQRLPRDARSPPSSGKVFFSMEDPT